MLALLETARGSRWDRPPTLHQAV